ncbi:hexose kinase [Paratractidigestivibacter sp.]|uniref:hexose kinase n=1 Tax=Paratractidigestivibacter sp. TaxID=2847316 RepID=UPI002AC90E5F|nr:hexose kinase [Paratractidigestivibacter sp.]
MILTVTMNPSIDTAYHLDGPLVIDDVNRVAPIKTAGGKGLNVTRVLGQLGDDVMATGLLGGKMGEFLADRMDEDGVKHDFARIAGESRVCIAVLHEGNQTEFLESGPEVGADELEGFVEKFRELAEKADVVTMSGSLPRGVDAGCYARLAQIASEAGAKVLLDTSGASLDAALAAKEKPYLVKPNLSELGALLGRTFDPDDIEALKAAIDEDGRFDGVVWVVVSMGDAGSVAFVGDEVYRAKAPRIECVNATGSGDSTIAGFAHGITAAAEPAEVLRLGNTCGTLNAMDPKTGHLPMDKWNDVYEAVEVTKL